MCPTPTDWCMISQCDNTAGCIEVPRTCLTKDADCYVGVCNSQSKKCETQERKDFAKITTDKHGGVTCFLYYKKKTAAAIITGGAVAGVVIGAVIFAVLAALGARQAYLWMQLRTGAIAGAQANPLYQPNLNAGVNPLYA